MADGETDGNKSKARQRLKRIAKCHRPDWLEDRWYPTSLRMHRGRRLFATIKTYAREIDPGIPTRLSGDELTMMAGCLEAALRALKSKDIDLGWRMLHAAKRVELLGLDDAMVAAEAKGNKAEADQKLSSWRKTTVSELVAPTEGEVTRQNLRAAARIRDEHFENLAYKRALSRGNALSLGIVLMAALAGIAILAATGHLKVALPPNHPNVTVTSLLTVALFGLAGAAMSAGLKAPRASAVASIPELLSGVHVTTLRLALGVASAVIIYVVVVSKSYAVVIKERPDLYGMMILAFAAGFTERLVIRVVEKMAGEKPAAT